MDSKIMEKILHNDGFRFQNIQEATHALPLLIEQKPHLIFLDLVMPIANGYEICAQVRRVSLFRDIPIVIVTSNDTFADRVRAKMVGATGFMSKPIERDKVLKVVHNLLRKKLAAC
ncbi:MAG: response regulator [Phormidesmis sp. RL_2_1]|nr:response regulator [Phormidesmis sp. RL_2_1]